MERKQCDILVVGSGPAGLSAAINAAANGFSTICVEGSNSPGGRAKESGAIENYPGFPHGISGKDLMHLFVQQARNFEAEIHCPVNIQNIKSLDNGKIVSTTDDYCEYESRAVILALGLGHARHPIANIGHLVGRSVFYGAPVHPTGRESVVVGGANSAGQAVLRLAKIKGHHIHMILRRELESTMAKYLIYRIRKLSNVTLYEHHEISKIEQADESGNTCYLTLSDNTVIKTNNVYMFVGGSPKTRWAQDAIQLDSRKYIVTDANYHTDFPGVFACGDVRSTATNGVAAAIGEGFAAFYKAYDWLSKDKV